MGCQDVLICFNNEGKIKNRKVNRGLFQLEYVGGLV